MIIWSPTFHSVDNLKFLTSCQGILFISTDTNNLHCAGYDRKENTTHRKRPVIFLVEDQHAAALAVKDL